MKFVIPFLFLSSILTVTYCNPNTDTNVLNQFTLKFYEKAVKRYQDKNFISSPLSIDVILGLLAFGARGGTQQEILKVLKFDDLNAVQSKFGSTLNRLNRNEGGILKMANKIYLRKGQEYTLNPVFKKTATDIFMSDVQNVDFTKRKETTEIINGWIEEKTNGKIKDFIKPGSLSPDTIMSLINAIYFNGDWELAFKERATFDGQFQKTASSSVPQKMMVQTAHFKHANLPELDSQILELSYKMEGTKLLVILPNKVDGLNKLEGQINTLNVKSLMERMQEHPVLVKLPKFKIESSIDLIDILQEVGLKDMFDATSSDFGALLKNPSSLYVNKAVQKAFIEVNERGTEAAAVTKFDMLRGSAPRYLDAINFIADHPFLYMLVNNDDIIFCGRYIGA